MTIVARMFRANQQKKRGTNVFTKAKAKEEAKEKVREIMLRQQNWMKQQEEEQQEAANVSTLSSSSDVGYTELFSNLKTRHEVLAQESSNLRNQFNECTQNIQKQRKQVENIEREEAKLTNEIAELTSRLHYLRGHRSEYEVKITEVGQKKEELARQLRLIEDTLANVANQMEKVSEIF